MTNDSTALIHFDAARRELAVAHSVDERHIAEVKARGEDRLWFMSQCVKSRQMPGTEKPNGDGSSLFRAFRIADLPASFVVARKFATKSGA